MQTFAAHQIAALRSQFANIRTVSTDRLPQFHAILSKMTDAQLLQVADAKIAFLSSLARNEAVRRGIR